MAKITQTPIKGFRFGTAIKISPKANAFLNNPGLKVEYLEKTVSIIIGIGPDHCAHLIMDLDTWEKMTMGAEINIPSYREFTGKKKR